MLAAGAAIFAVSGPASTQPTPAQRQSQFDFRAEPVTPFEKTLLKRASVSGSVSHDETRGPAGNNARGLIVTGGDWAIMDLAVNGRKYGVSIDGTDSVLIKNFSFRDRRSTDIYGSGIVVGSKTGTRGDTWISNAWIDLGEAGPVPDYRKANNEGLSVERGNALVNIRRAVLIGAQESGIDNKGDIRMDASFVAAGHRSIRIWSGGSLVVANSTILALPGYHGLWFGGGAKPARFAYYNCRFGRVGDRPEDLTADIPKWMIAVEDDVDVRIIRLDRDPFDRSPDAFWAPARAPLPAGYLAGR